MLFLRPVAQCRTGQPLAVPLARMIRTGPLAAGLLLLLFSRPILADDPVRGLLARISSADRTIERVDTDVQFTWGEDSPDPRLSGRELTARWTGRLLTPSAGTYRFHLFVQGQATLSVAGREAVAGRLDRAAGSRAAKCPWTAVMCQSNWSFRRPAPPLSSGCSGRDQGSASNRFPRVCWNVMLATSHGPKPVGLRGESLFTVLRAGTAISARG